MRVRSGWIAVLLAAAAVASAARAPADPACSSGRILGVRGALFVLATAGTDTVRAGPGPVEYPAPEEGAPPHAAIHGQRFRLDRLGGDVPAELAGAEGGEAVLVAYASQCGDAWRWRQARWARPGTQVFADVRLRPRAQWVDGRPTFDVDMLHGAYPEAYRRMASSVPADSLTPAQMFGMNQALPTFAQREADPAAAYGPLLAWARANPALAARFPAAVTLDEAMEALQPCVPAYDVHPAAGTYRVTVVVQGTDTLVTFLRTHARGYPECGAPERRLDSAVVRPRPAGMARLHVHGAPDAAAIPDGNREAWNDPASCGVGSVEVFDPPVSADGGGRAWRADYNHLALPACFRDRPEVKAVTEALFSGYRAGERNQPPGWFIEGPDGGMRFEQRWQTGGRVVLEMTATRVSTRTLPE